MSSETLTAYLCQIGKYPQLSREQESTATPEQLITANLRLVVHIAKAYTHSKQELVDAIQDGNEGLVIATTKFDPSRGAFSTIAGFYIRTAIREARLKMSRTVRLPRTINPSTLVNIKDRHADGEKPAKIAAELGIPINGVNAAISHTFGEPTEDLVSDNDPADLCDREMVTRVAHRTLKEQELQVLMARFDGQTLIQVSEIHNKSREWVRQSQKISLNKLANSR